MNNWITLTPADIVKVLNPDELNAYQELGSDTDLTEMIDDIIVTVREAIANNKANTLGSDGMIPQSLRREALALLRMDIINRYNVSYTETDQRPKAATLAQEKLRQIAKGEWQIIGINSDVPTPPSSRPWASAPRQAVGNDAVGMFPLPLPTSSR